MTRFNLDERAPVIAEETAKFAGQYALATKRQIDVARAVVIRSLVTHARHLTTLNMYERGGVPVAGSRGEFELTEKHIDQIEAARTISETHVLSSVEHLFKGEYVLTFLGDPICSSVHVRYTENGATHDFYIDGGYQ